MYAEATITLNQSQDVLVIPVEAVDRTEHGARVLVVTQNRVEPRDVTIGLEAGDRVEVTMGLGVNDLVVVGNRSQLKAGAVVTPKLLTTKTPTEGAH